MNMKQELRTLYTVSINGSVKYFSTSCTEISDFANIFGMTGHVNIHAECRFEIPNVVAQHPEGTFNKIKRQYLPQVNAN